MYSLSYIKKIAKGAALVLTSMIIGKLFSYLYIILVANKLGSHDYGVLSLGFAIFSLASAFSLLGLDEGIIRFVSFFKGKNDLSSLKGTILISLKTVLNTSIFFSILLIVFSDFISNTIFNEFELTKVLFFLALALPFSAIAQLFLASFRAFQKPKFEVLIKELIEKFFRLIISALLISLSYKLFGAILGYSLAIFIMFCSAFIIFNKKIFNLFNKNIESKENKKELLGYSLPLLLKNLLWFTIGWINILMLGYFKTTSDVGIYNVALPTSTLLMTPTFSIMYLFLPIISELYSKNNLNEINNVYKKISKYIFMINIPIFLIISLLSKEIVFVLFGNEYLKAVVPLVILSFGYLAFSLSDISINTLSVLKKTKIIFAITLLFSLLNAILNYLLIPKYNLIGASIATSSSLLIGSILMIVISYYYTKLHPFAFNYKKLIISLLIPLIIVIIIKKFIILSALINLIIFTPLILLVYIISLFTLKVFEEDDIEFLKEIKNKIKFLIKI